MDDSRTTFQQVKTAIAQFVKDREWEIFHDPKNLSMALAVEAAELMEIYQWITSETSRTYHQKRNIRKKVEDELADIACYLLALCNVLSIDLSVAIANKMKKNAKKYPPLKKQKKRHPLLPNQKTRSPS